MERRQFTREFKLEAVRLIKQRGVSYAQASKDLVVHPTRLRNWVKQLADDPQHAFPGHGQMKPEQLEIAQLKREVAKLKAEQDILQRIRFAASPDRHHHRTAHSRVSTSRSETMAPSRAATFNMSRQVRLITARAESSSGRAAQCMRARRFCIVPSGATAVYARSNRSAVQKNHHARPRTISMSARSTLPGLSLAPRASNSRGVSARK
jgi:transposase